MMNIVHQWGLFWDGDWGSNKVRMGAVVSVRLQDINKKVAKKYRIWRVSRIWCSKMKYLKEEAHGT